MDSNLVSISFRPIGIIHSDHTVPEETPIQPVFAKDCGGRAEIRPEFADGLRDLDGFSHIYLLYHLHRADPGQLLVKPFLQDVERGVFSTRYPRRPNPIGLSIVRLLRREGNVLFLRDVDILDGTPLLDIKPYNARFDRIDPERNGWYADVRDEEAGRLGRRGYRGTTESVTDRQTVNAEPRPTESRVDEYEKEGRP